MFPAAMLSILIALVPIAAFAATYKGTCTSCHAVDAKTGRVTVVGLPPR